MTETPTPPPESAELSLQGRAPSLISGRWPIAILLLLGGLPYLGLLRNDFVYMYDDKPLILDSPYIHSALHLRELLTSTLFSNQGTPGGPPYYRPIAKLGFFLCYQIFGPWAPGFHLASLLLNVAVVSALFLFANQLLRSRPAGLVAAALFAIHPVHVEAVAWISSVSDLEVSFFYLLTFWYFLRALDSAGRGRGWLIAAMTGSFTLCLLSKEQAITLPVLATVYAFFFRGDRDSAAPARKILCVAPLWIASAAYFLLRIRLFGSFAEVKRANPLDATTTVLSALALVGQYLGKIFWPVHLSAFNLFYASTSALSWRVAAGLAALALAAWVFYLVWNRCRPASFGVLWFFVTIAPVLNTRWMGAYALGERYLYLPSVGFCVILGWSLNRYWETSAQRRDSKRTALAVAGVVVAILSVLRISTRIPAWYDDVTLFTYSLAETPEDYRLHDALGAADAIRGNREGAEIEWKEALRLDPASVEPLTSLGSLYAQEGRFAEAMPLLENALQINPQSADLRLNLGSAYAETGKMDLAEQQFRAAVVLSPLNYAAHNVLGKLYFDSHRFAEAEEQFRLSLQCEPNIAAADYLGYIFEQRGNTSTAERAFRAALIIKSSDSHAHYHLGLIEAAAGNIPQAQGEFQAALAADPGNSEIVAALQKVRDGQSVQKPN